MKINKLSLALGLTLSLGLTGCGGGSNSDSDTPDNAGGASSNKTYTVIDGYLQYASVCHQPVGSDECTKIATTDENGQFELDEKYSDGTLIASIIKGETRDADVAGTVTESYQLASKIAGDYPSVVTPFTTLDVLDDSKTLDQISAELDLPAALISGDYIASDDADHEKVHLLARSIVKQLAPELENNEVDELNKKVDSINDYIDQELVNNSVDLDTVTVEYKDDNLNTSEIALLPSLTEYLADNTLYFSSFNPAQFKDEGIRPAVYTKDTVTVGEFSDPYKVEGNYLVMGNDGKDLFIYIGNNISLSVPGSGDLTLMSPINYSQLSQATTWQQDDLVGATLYQLFDDADNSDIPDPSLVAMAYSQNTFAVHSDGKDVDVPWAIENGELVIKLIEAGIGKRTPRYQLALSTPDLYVAFDNDIGGVPVLFVKDKNLANELYTKWSNALK